MIPSFELFLCRMNVRDVRLAEHKMAFSDTMNGSIMNKVNIIITMAFFPNPSNVYLLRT